MLKVIIVDDERRTRLGIMNLINWDKLGFEVVDTASDGYTAIEKYQEHEPDLIMIDIKMPKLSGIETIKKIREEDTKVKFLILSGYAEFQYAKQAMQYQVEGYLLKPLEEEELINYLRKIHNDIIKENLRKDAKENEHFQKNMDLLIRRNISNKVNDFFQQKFNWDFYAILLIKFFDTKQLDLREVFQSVTRYVNKNDGQLFIKDGYIGILVRENVAENNAEKIYDSVYEFLKEKKLEFTSAVSDSVTSIDNLANCYQQAKSYLQNSFYYMAQNMITKYSPMIQERDIKWSGKQLAEYYEKLLYAVEISDCETIKQMIRDIIVFLAKSRYSELKIKEQMANLLTDIDNNLMVKYPEIRAAISTKLRDIVQIQKSFMVKELISLAYEHLSEISSLIDEDKPELTVKRMIQFIQKNYNQNIKLDTMAELLHYHKAYLGKIFKETTGEYFRTYLDKVRIDNSKRLLQEEYKIYEVAQMVGYTSSDYFHSKFKKYEGISPSDFRKRYHK
ncbi:response regulator transcription factor [Gracilibacillus suaedae]|uniref:response regulator transcription factor n=1 Tax=Gracilibacillus suaedae TaxID=2820273 RepID=UPI001ABEBD61|nr:response regulator [Gracilibacillus suaedae]